MEQGESWAHLEGEELVAQEAEERAPDELQQQVRVSQPSFDFFVLIYFSRHLVDK